ncbi:MAG: type III pantothenate kinase [Vulcanimicrobiaceae bacterium]|jgi:type III pantothenate kinase
MLVCIDVGNTETKLGAFDAAGTLVGTWRVTTARRRTPDEFGVLFSAFFSAARFPIGEVETIIVSSVVPVVDRPLAEGCEKYFGVRPRFFTAATQRAIVVRTDRPREVGSDLIAAAIGAVSFVGVPSIVINFGTATTFGAIDRDGAYVGAAIATGLQVSLDALVARAAKLPQVALVAPGSPIGKETVASIQAGLIYGAVGQTEELVRRFREVLGAEARVIASGGLAPVVAAEARSVERVEPHLVLHGLRLAFLANGFDDP